MQSSIRALSTLRGGDTNMAEGRMDLITIPHSTYCEAARWAAQASGIAYDETMFPLSTLLLHRGPVAVMRMTHPKEMEAIKQESIPCGAFEGQPKEVYDQRTQGSMVPVAVASDSTFCGDSYNIVKQCAAQSGGQLAPPTEEWRSQLDVYGAAVRNFVYYYMSPKGVCDDSYTMDDLCAATCKWYYCVGDEALRAKQTAMMKETYSMNSARQAGLFRFDAFDEEMGPKAQEVMDKMFESVLARLQEQGTPFLGGDILGGDDIIFAAHTSWLTLPSTFGGGNLSSEWLTKEDVGPKLAKIVEKYRNTEVGKYVMRLYAENRVFEASNKSQRRLFVQEPPKEFTP
jgi:hypothetical protein